MKLIHLHYNLNNKVIHIKKDLSTQPEKNWYKINDRGEISARLFLETMGLFIKIAVDGGGTGNDGWWIKYEVDMK